MGEPGAGDEGTQGVSHPEQHGLASSSSHRQPQQRGPMSPGHSAPNPPITPKKHTGTAAASRGVPRHTGGDSLEHCAFVFYNPEQSRSPCSVKRYKNEQWGDRHLQALSYSKCTGTAWPGLQALADKSQGEPPGLSPEASTWSSPTEPQEEGGVTLSYSRHHQKPGQGCRLCAGSDGGAVCAQTGAAHGRGCDWSVARGPNSVSAMTQDDDGSSWLLRPSCPPWKGWAAGRPRLGPHPLGLLPSRAGAQHGVHEACGKAERPGAQQEGETGLHLQGVNVSTPST